MTNRSDKPAPSNLVDKILQWETDGMEQEEMVEFFQELIDSGLAWQLQGCYGRQAAALIEAGLCTRRAGL